MNVAATPGVNTYFAGSPVKSTGLSSDANINALLFETTTGSGQTDYWDSNKNYTQTASETIITYSFVADDSVKFAGGYTEPTIGTDTITAFTEEQKTAARDALEEWSKVADLEFVEVDETTDLVGTFRFGFTQSSDPNTAGWATPPTENPSGGDIWLSESTFNDSYAQGTSYGFATLLHEIGHALGLKHPFEDGVTLPANLDLTTYTIMSYTDDDTAGSSVWNYENNPYGDYIISSTPMLFDVAAVQHLYGAAENNVGATIYEFDPTKAEAKTIWDSDAPDSGFSDIFDLSLYSFGVDVDLNEGASSTIPTETWTLNDNISIAMGTTIENVITGSGDDHIVGNSVANEINSGGGDDVIATGDGSDIVVFQSGFGNDTITDFELGVDKLAILKSDNSLYTSAELSAYENSGNLVVTVASDTITLQNLDRVMDGHFLIRRLYHSRRSSILLTRFIGWKKANKTIECSKSLHNASYQWKKDTRWS